MMAASSGLPAGTKGDAKLGADGRLMYAIVIRRGSGVIPHGVIDRHECHTRFAAWLYAWMSCRDDPYRYWGWA